jgi:3-oxoacyl-[acyl-carrier-protein] synthase-3
MASETPIRIVGTGAFLPGPAISNQKIEEVFAVRADWIDFTIGTRSRHFVLDLDTREVRYRLADLCEHAGRSAMQAAGIAAGAIDLVVMSTATPDDLIPATVNVVADRLGLNRVSTLQIQAGCSGAIQSIQVAANFLRAGAARNVLIVAGDACYRYIDFDRDFRRAPANELVNLAIFGEAAGAAVLSADPGREGIRVCRTVNRCEGLGRTPGHIMRWFGPSRAAAGTTPAEAAGAWEDYKAVQSSVPDMAAQVLAELVADMGTDKRDVTHWLPPQLGGHMSARIVKHLDIDPGKTVTCVADTGNCGNAMPLLQLDMLAPRMRAGDTAVAIAIESSKWLKTGLSLESN